jgi:hypothetical protein
MKISLKTMKILGWLVTFNFLVGFMLVSQLKPEAYTWRVATLQVMFYCIIVGLLIYISKVFGKAIISGSSNHEPRFDSRIKNQLWGLLLRTVYGAMGLGFVAVFLPQPIGVTVAAALLYGVVLLGGFVNDGKRYDKSRL